MFFMALIPEDSPKSASPAEHPVAEIAQAVQDQFQMQSSLIPGFGFNPHPWHQSPMEKDYLKYAGKKKPSHKFSKSVK